MQDVYCHGTNELVVMHGISDALHVNNIIWLVLHLTHVVRTAGVFFGAGERSDKHADRQSVLHLFTATPRDTDYNLLLTTHLKKGKIR